MTEKNSLIELIFITSSRSTVVDILYTNKLTNRMLSKCFLMDAHRKVDLSGSLAAGGEIHHVMTGRRGL